MADKKKNSSQSQVAALKASEKVQSLKSAKAPAREPRTVPARQESKTTTVKRDAPRAATSPSMFARARNSKSGRFLYDAYYELRHKVTWPTFLEARNMTIAVIAISVVIGGLLSLLDLGLFHLFLLISGSH